MNYTDNIVPKKLLRTKHLYLQESLMLLRVHFVRRKRQESGGSTMEEALSCIEVNNEMDIVEIRRLGRELARELGFGNVDQVRITTAISELARNIYLYAPGGEISLRSVESLNRVGLTVNAKDHGPGIKDIRQVLEDGYTTSCGLGAGLPGVKRLMDEFDIHSTVGEGTEIEVTKWMVRNPVVF
jgi:serine/threonine-protein kinase RsbT